MLTRDTRAAKRARKTIELFAELPFYGVKYLDLLTPHDSAMRAALNNVDEAETSLRLRMNQARFHNARIKNRYLDLFTAEEMQDVQMMDEAEMNADRQRAVLGVALESFYLAIEQVKKARKVIKRLRRQYP